MWTPHGSGSILLSNRSLYTRWRRSQAGHREELHGGSLMAPGFWAQLRREMGAALVGRGLLCRRRDRSAQAGASAGLGAGGPGLPLRGFHFLL